MGAQPGGPCQAGRLHAWLHHETPEGGRKQVGQGGGYTAAQETGGFLDSVTASHYFANKGPSSQSYGFSSSHVGSGIWTIKKAEHQIVDAFGL